MAMLGSTTLQKRTLAHKGPQTPQWRSRPTLPATQALPRPKGAASTQIARRAATRACPTCATGPANVPPRPTMARPATAATPARCWRSVRQANAWPNWRRGARARPTRIAGRWKTATSATARCTATSRPFPSTARSTRRRWLSVIPRRTRPARRTSALRRRVLAKARRWRPPSKLASPAKAATSKPKRRATWPCRRWPARTVRSAQAATTAAAAPARQERIRAPASPTRTASTSTTATCATAWPTATRRSRSPRAF